MKRLSLANTPTPIEPIQFIEADLPVNLYIKRDDMTGLGLSGNKVRKLEYILWQALKDQVTDVITCGAIQSNHARATAMACARLGLDCHLFLAGQEAPEKEGNLFFEVLAGAEVRMVSGQDYDQARETMMADWARDIEASGDKKVLVIPEGGSNPLGSFGYVRAFEEILAQEEEMGLHFQKIALAAGSFGTYAGLVYGNAKFNAGRDLLAYNISGQAQDKLDNRLLPILEGMGQLDEAQVLVDPQSIKIRDGYQGLGYAKSRIEELEFIRDFASQTGIILDPVYTGKAMYGLVTDLLKNPDQPHQDVLFIHTGGAFGWTQAQRNMLLL
ncbi:MAG: D-cysteine desulfhydrase family protein [Tissierellia bacterium]|nr:D-cysteine desulfhydrase family protein [Tissierellia bacterium]